jgi:hypothetical protein
MDSLECVKIALDAQRFETARRLGLRILRDNSSPSPAIVLDLHDALAALAEFREASDLIEAHAHTLNGEDFAVQLRLAKDAHFLIGEHHYRVSDEASRGLTLEQYQAHYRQLAKSRFDATLTLAQEPSEQALLREALMQCGQAIPESLQPVSELSSDKDDAVSLQTGAVSGRMLTPEGAPIAGALMTLGLAMTFTVEDPTTYISPSPDYQPQIGDQEKRITQTDDDGRFLFKAVPTGCHAFLAVTLNLEEHAIPTRFLEREISVGADEVTELGALIAREWTSAPAQSAQSPHPETLESDGQLWTKCLDQRLSNPFHYDFRRQPLRLPLPEHVAGKGHNLRVELSSQEPCVCQEVDGACYLLCDLPARSERFLAVYWAESSVDCSVAGDSTLPLVRFDDHSNESWELDTGVACLRLPGPAMPADSAPILAVRGVDAVWRGQGRLILPEGLSVLERCTEVLHRGKVFCQLRLSYRFENGQSAIWLLSAWAGEPLFEVHEVSSDIEGCRFEFSLQEFSGGRSYLNWVREEACGARHWSSLEKKDALLARLSEHVPWWIPPQGFGCAVTADSVTERDTIGVCTLRRGEWIDRAFEKIAQGPVGEDGQPNYELDWPYPEMVGSSISMITAHTRSDGDVLFNFGFFDGERRWGLYVSDFEKNDGPWKEFGLIQHAYSSPRLQDFMNWQFDVPDTEPRPRVLASREQLQDLRRKREHPRFAGLWQKISKGHVLGSARGLSFALEGDPSIAWRIRNELLGVAGIRARMTLLGRDWSDMFSPVYGRPLTAWVEEYDLIAGSGVFTEQEERELRAFFILMGHMYAEPDFMNWHFNSRNANFDADRTDIIGAVGLVFEGHPDANKFLGHVIDLMDKSLQVYCTPGSGKWYENPGCYYLVASKCRLNLLIHLVREGRMDPAMLSRLKDFVRWGIRLLMPPTPVAYERMCQGPGTQAYNDLELMRKVPPIGDHSSIGRWLSDHYFVLGKLMMERDPEFGRELMDAWFVANADGRRLITGRDQFEQEGEQIFHDATDSASFGNLPLLFTAIEEADIPEALPQLALESQRLQGFGAVFRQGVNTPSESYVLLKQGPGGYRYHRTEGSFIFFANGHPLVFDGGEAGETWRHSTLSFYEEQMPMSAGRVEQFFASEALHFSQGVHPCVVQPGDPVFLSDDCHHSLVPEAWRRFQLDSPAVVRSLAWLQGGILIIHDQVNVPADVVSQWHLQVVGAEPTGDLKNSGLRFSGRFGTDLHVSFPGLAEEATWQSEPQPILEYTGKPEDWFTMEHLQVASEGTRDYLAVLQPLVIGEAAARTEPIVIDGNRCGVCVTDSNMDQRVWFGRRDAIEDAGEDYFFRGTTGALLCCPEKNVFALMAAGILKYGNLELQSEGPVVSLCQLQSGQLSLTAQGAGRVTLVSGSGKQCFEVREGQDLFVDTLGA